MNRVTVPKHVQALQPGCQHRWMLSLSYNPKRPSQNAYATAWVERVTLTSEQQASLHASLQQERASVLAQNGVWYDALALLTKNPAGFASPLEAAEHLLNQTEAIKATLSNDV
ncbi:MAG: DUF928 domain-containing protein [Cyanobacteria bacterium P01_A01_bin.17]